MSDRFVNDVAKQLERRARRRRLGVLGAVGAAVAAAILYLRCGSGWGTGGAGPGNGPGVGRTEPAAPKRCAIRVTAKGLIVDGKPATRDDAVATCKTTGRALVIVAGDAREGDWTELEQALQAAHVAIDQRDR
jgi:hypothetical protein